jgi:hypothetical protein
MLSCFVGSDHHFLTASWTWRLASGLATPKLGIRSLSYQKKLLCSLAETHNAGVSGEILLTSHSGNNNYNHCILCLLQKYQGSSLILKNAIM